MSDLKIRPYASADRAAIETICFETALYGQSIAEWIPDRALIAETWIGYYRRYEPELFFVAEFEGHVVGYITGSVDTRRARRLFWTMIMPRLVARFILKGHWARAWFWKLLRTARRSESYSGEPRRDIERQYPAHCHINFAAGFRKKGGGARLWKALQDALRTAGISGIHVVSGTPAGHSFFGKQGFSEVAREGVISLGRHPPSYVAVLVRAL